jgi:hypothetical protein
MQPIKTIVLSLLEEGHRPDSLVLSAYIPIEEEVLRPDIYTKVKSIILKHLRNNDKASQFSDKHLDFIENIKQTLDKVDDLHKGLAIFLRAEPGGLSTEVSVKTVPLPQKPEKEVFIGEIYDLDQLIWIDNYSPKSIVTVLNNKSAQIYSYEDVDIELLGQKNNPYLISEPNEYREKFNPTPTDQVTHGTGGKNTQRQKDKVSRKFVKMIINEIIEKITTEEKFEYCILFHSSNFDQYEDMIVDRISTKTGLTPILSPKNVDSQEELLKHTQKIINDFRTQTVEDVIKQAKSNPSLFAAGWYEVSEASRQGKIENLFITPDLKKPGYLLENDSGQYVYSHAVKDSHKISNIGPWIVRNVLEKSGKILTIPDEDLLEDDIAAQLRY